MLINTMGYKPLFANSFMAVMIGYLANLALPRLGEVVRCSILFKYDKVPVTKSFGTVVTERAIDLFTFLFFFIITILVQFHLLKDYAYDTVYLPLADKLQGMFSIRIILILLIIITFFVLIFIFFLRKKISHLKIYIRITEMIKGFWLGLKSVAKVKSPFLFIFYSVVIWVCYLFTAYFAFFALQGTSGLGLDAALASLSFGTIGIMVIQGGIGIYPIIISETLSLYSIDKLIGYGFGWLAWSLQTAEIIVGGLLSFTLLPVINKKKHAAG